MCKPSTFSSANGEQNFSNSENRSKITPFTNHSRFMTQMLDTKKVLALKRTN